MDYHTEDRWKRYQQSVGTNRCHNKMVQQDGTTRCYTTRWDNIKYQRTHNVVKYTVSDCASNTGYPVPDQILTCRSIEGQSSTGRIRTRAGGSELGLPSARQDLDMIRARPDASKLGLADESTGSQNRARATRCPIRSGHVEASQTRSRPDTSELVLTDESTGLRIRAGTGR